MIDFDILAKISLECGGNLIVAKALKSYLKSNKLPNLVTLVER